MVILWHGTLQLNVYPYVSEKVPKLREPCIFTQLLEGSSSMHIYQLFPVNYLHFLTLYNHKYVSQRLMTPHNK